MKKYIVTGAAGFIGSAVAKKLSDMGNTIVSIDNLTTGFRSNLPKNIEFIEGDCGDPDVYSLIPRDSYDAVIHIAGQSSGEISFDDPIYDIRTNTNSTLLLLDYMREINCKRFIYAGSMSVYGKQPEIPINEDVLCNPESFYGVGKLASEHYMRIYEQFDIASTSLRLFNVYGPGQNLENLRQGMVSIFMAQMFEKNHIIVKGASDRFRDFVYIDDVVEAFISSIQNDNTKNQVINVATGIKTSVKELIEKICILNDSEITVEYQGTTSGDIHGIYADINKMKKLLGIDQPIELDQGLLKMIAWMKTQ